VIAQTDRDAIEMALTSLASDAANARVVHIRNTRSLGEMRVSGNLLEEAVGRGASAGTATGLCFDEEGNLIW
jgi:hypothetical protein